VCAQSGPPPTTNNNPSSSFHPLAHSPQERDAAAAALFNRALRLVNDTKLPLLPELVVRSKLSGAAACTATKRLIFEERVSMCLFDIDWQLAERRSIQRSLGVILFTVDGCRFLFVM
jgi:hypothetical protein